MKAKFLIAVSALVLSFLVIVRLMFYVALAQSECFTPGCLQSTNCAHWPKGQGVVVLINGNDFNAVEQAAIREAFTNWQNANGATGNGSGVTFTFDLVTEAPAPSQTNCHYVQRATTTTGGGVSSISATTTSTGEVITTRAETSIGSAYHTTTTDTEYGRTIYDDIVSIMAHEIGHPFGLDDAYEHAGQTVMGTTNCPAECVKGPTTCDNDATKQHGYPTPTPAPSPTPTPPPVTCPACPNADWSDCPSNCFGPVDVCVNGGTGCPAVPGVEQSACWCYRPSPIVVDVSGNGFNLTNAANGVDFDMTSDGVPERLSWTKGNSDDAWLVLDRNGNGTIDDGSELFGSFSPQPPPPAGEEKNGFLALAEYDRPANGGNGDGIIRASDAIFSSLRLWQDTNHNGISESSELHTLPQVGLMTLHLDYEISNRRDRHGNLFKYRAKVKDTHDAQLGRWAWDVILMGAN